MAYEMGLKPHEVDTLTLAQFNMMYAGYKSRREDDWDIGRRTWEYIVNFAGMGVKGKYMHHTELLPLERDKEMQNKTIKTKDAAYKLLKEFY